MFRLMKQKRLRKKGGRRHIHVSRSSISLFDPGTLVVWRVCMKFSTFDSMCEPAIYSIYKVIINDSYDH